MTVCGKKFGEWVAEVISNEGGDDVLVSKWNDKQVTSPCRVEVVLPSSTWMDTGLRVSGGRCLILLVCL